MQRKSIDSDPFWTVSGTLINERCNGDTVNDYYYNRNDNDINNYYHNTNLNNNSDIIMTDH